MRRATWLVLAMAGAACGVQKPPVEPPVGIADTVPPASTEAPARPWWGVSEQASPPTDTPTLQSFTGPGACQALEQHLEDRAVLQLRLELEANRFSALQWWQARQHWLAQGGTGGWYGGDLSGIGGGDGTPGAAPPSGPSGYTTTNTQVATVDEADFVKNDGTRLFVLSGSQLQTVSTWPATALARRGSLHLEGAPLEMFLDGDRLMVFSRVLDARVGGAPSWCSAASGSACALTYGNGTLVTWVDVSDLANPVVLSTSLIPGRYFSARRMGTTVRLVSQSSAYDGLGVTTRVEQAQQEAAQSAAELSALYDDLEARGEATLRGRTLTDWLPPAWRGQGNSATPVSLDCASVLAPKASARLGFASVTTLDTQNPAPLARTVLLAAVDELSMSEHMLIVGQRHWWWRQPWWPARATEANTYLYAFDTASTAGVTLLGAGRVLGLPVSQFSIDESDGVIRLAVTEFPASGGMTNRVLTLAPDGHGLLAGLGRTGELAPGEQVMSARFVGPTAYVVTFRQTDPFFVVDLADPRAPAKVGELKLPGFSSYLHPFDATHVLAVGTAPSPQGPGWTVQVSLFDVSDKTQPRQQYQVSVGTSSSGSSAEWDHKAFTFFPQKGLLALPVFDMTPNVGASGATWTATSDLRVFRVDVASGITALGALPVGDLVEAANCPSYSRCWGWDWYPMVRRSIMADDFVYAVSSGGVRVAAATDLATPLATAVFPRSP